MAALLSVPTQLGLVALAALVGLEAGGLPVPGETALVTSGVLAQQGKFSIVAVIAVAATAAIVGDNIGYVLGRRYGRWLLERPGRFQERRREALEKGEGFFERHGPRAVFFGRWILGLRVWASWLAGATHMPWRSFLAWNALGGISWAVTVGLGGYLLGSAAEKIFQTAGVGALVLVVAVAAVGLAVWHRRSRRTA